MIIFRCNAGPEIGFGHLVRCRALANALSELGETCVMFGPDQSYSQSEDQAIFSEWVRANPWSSALNDAHHLIHLASTFAAKFAVLDDYRIDEPYQLALRAAGLKWLQIDGTAKNPIWADLLLIPNLALRESDYAGLIKNPCTKLISGPRYALLRKGFPPPNLRSLDRDVSHILIIFGAGDDRGAIEFVLSALIDGAPKHLHYTVVSGSHNPRNQQIKDWIHNNANKRVRLAIDPKDTASVFSKSDMVISAGGSSTYEAASCGLPMILISVANNQTKQCEAWENLGTAVYLGHFPDVSEKQLSDTVSHLVNDTHPRINMARVGKKTVDGLGASRVADILKNLCDSSTKPSLFMTADR